MSNTFYYNSNSFQSHETKVSTCVQELLHCVYILHLFLYCATADFLRHALNML
jgi:hypothetical protein